VEELTTLIEASRAGDKEAYSHLVRRFQDMAVGYAYSLLGDFHLAEDAAQESFLLAYLDLEGLREPAAFPGWFRRIIHTQCGRQRRRGGPRTEDLEAAEPVSAGQNPAEALLAGESEDQLLRALDALPERDRSIVALFYISKLTHKEIAAFLDLPESTINNRLYVSRKALREELTRMTAERLRTSRPSRDDEFVGRIEGRVTALEALHRGLADGLGEVVSKTLGNRVTATIGDVTRTTFEEYLKALSSPSLTLHYQVEPIGGRIVFDLSPELAFVVAERILETGKDDWPQVGKEMSLDDWNRLAPFGKSIQSLLESIWNPVLPVELTDGVWESNIVGLMAHPDFSTLPLSEKLAELHAAPEEPAVRLDLVVRVGERVCQLSLCYPSMVLHGVLPHLG
jgi:RNA polymerase sigma factor (sigma-70 family)